MESGERQQKCTENSCNIFVIHSHHIPSYPMAKQSSSSQKALYIVSCSPSFTLSWWLKSHLIIWSESHFQIVIRVQIEKSESITNHKTGPFLDFYRNQTVLSLKSISLHFTTVNSVRYSTAHSTDEPNTWQSPPNFHPKSMHSYRFQRDNW